MVSYRRRIQFAGLVFHLSFFILTQSPFRISWRCPFSTFAKHTWDTSPASMGCGDSRQDESGSHSRLASLHRLAIRRDLVVVPTIRLAISPRNPSFDCWFTDAARNLEARNEVLEWKPTCLLVRPGGKSTCDCQSHPRKQTGNQYCLQASGSSGNGECSPAPLKFLREGWEAMRGKPCDCC